MPSILSRLRLQPLHAILAIVLILGFLFLAAIPLLQSPPHWATVFRILACELVGGALLVGFLFRRELGFHWDNPRSEETVDERDTRWTRNTVVIFGVLGLLSLLVLSLSIAPPQTWHDVARVFGTAALFAGAFFGVGALIGFLFGIPRSLQGKGAPKPESTGNTKDAGNANAQNASAAKNGENKTSDTAIYTTNTNLEEISDWLTKIIVGLGLINLKTIPTQLKTLAWYFSQFCDSRICESVALAIILYFFTCGFFLAYLMTRLFLTGAFTRADRAAAQERAEKRTAVNSNVASAIHDAETSPVSDSGDIEPLLERQVLRAQNIAKIVGTANRPNFKIELQSLAQRYDALRSSMEAGQERTRQMEGIAAGMRAYALTSYDQLDYFAASASPGERLVAVAFLEIKPDCRYLKWLSSRYSEDQPFIQYHAALGLRAAARNLRDQCGDEIRTAIQNALNVLGDDKTNTDRGRVLQQALVSLG